MRSCERVQSLCCLCAQIKAERLPARSLHVHSTDQPSLCLSFYQRGGARPRPPGRPVPAPSLEGRRRDGWLLTAGRWVDGALSPARQRPEPSSELGRCTPAVPRPRRAALWSGCHLAGARSGTGAGKGRCSNATTCDPLRVILPVPERA